MRPTINAWQASKTPEEEIVAFETLRKWYFEEAVNSLLDLMMGHFVRIDERLDLREEDKKRLKE